MDSTSPFMELAIAAARTARGHTSPNPWVGAVLVRDGQVLSTGCTAPYGGAHAEAAALSNVDARGATLYTTLEPCMPFEGKRTRPCVEAILEGGVARVVVGIEDPHQPVRGAGARYLRERGVEVTVGDGADEVTALLRPYLKFRGTGRPYVIAKLAISLDGKVGAPSEGVRWLTGGAARERAHADRAWVDAIAVGRGTVTADDPELTARPGGQPASRQPLRVLLDARGTSPVDSRAIGPGTIIATAAAPRPWREAVVARGASLIDLEPGEEGLNLPQLLRILGQRSVMSLIVEGGPVLLRSLFDEDLADEAHFYIAPKVLGGAGIPAFPGVHGVFPPVTLREVVVEDLAPDVLVRGYTGPWNPA
jgi:diaminohydroxyphosphoribosylaminopyrimidine deaminase/5-amino-6-(5-phosphoribosylamino)uracil reductase